MNKHHFKNNYWDLFYELIRTDFKMRYHDSVLGFIWVLLKPFLIFLIIAVVFSWFFKSFDPYYLLNLLLGILIFSYFEEATLRGVTCLYEKSTVILKVNFPKILAILTTVANSFISFFFGFLVFLIFWIWIRPTGSLIFLPKFFLLILFLSGLILGLNLFFSIIFTRFRDLLSIWEVLLKLIFYLTPIIYPLSYIPNKFQHLFLLNPLAIIITYSQNYLITGKALPGFYFYYALLTTLIILVLGYLFFKKNIKSVAENF